jgi:hypothetical protein
MLHELKLAVVGAFCAASLLTGARAEDSNSAAGLDPSALLNAMYAEMDEDRRETAQFVLAGAEARVADLAAVRHALPFPRPLVSAFVLAHLAP